MLKRYFYLLSFTALFLGSCSEGEFNPSPVLNPGDAPVITAPVAGTTFVLTEADAADTLTTFTWTSADFGFDAAITYTLEFDKAGNDFAAPVSLGSTTGLELNSVTVEKINNALIAKGFPGEVPVDIQLRLVAKIHSEVPEAYSAPVLMTFTPYTVVVAYPQLQVPGGYQGWDPSNNNTVIFSVNSNDRYEGYIYFKDPNTEFKYTLGPAWDTNWGDDGADGSLNPNGSNLKATDPGLYKLNVDLGALTHSFIKTDWGLIGDATPGGWDNDQNMTYDPVANKLTITLDLTAAKIKFRANDDWAINLGDNDADKKMEYGGADIIVPEAGNYTVELILSGAVYTYKLTKN